MNRIHSANDVRTDESDLTRKVHCGDIVSTQRPNKEALICDQCRNVIINPNSVRCPRCNYLLLRPCDGNCRHCKAKCDG